MERRPPSVTLISYLLILFGFFGILAGFYFFYKSVDDAKFQEAYQANPHVVWGIFVFMGINFIISIVTGKFMLEAANWARITYTIWTGIVLTLTLLGFSADQEIRIISTFVVQGIVLTCLFLPGANKFFSSRYYGI